MQRSQYRLLGLVGHGQFGQVYCAIHRKTGALVALKYLRKDRFPTHKFLRELRFLLSLEHPNIVTCHALEHAGNGRQLVLDYCESGTLRSILDSDIVLTLEEALGFVLDILAGLEHAHQQGIVHCDIKPENVLLQLTPEGWLARLSDFGVARLSQDGRASEMGHTGSPAYMAPERFYNQHPTASDIYAVGIILYELLLGKRPFSGTPLELMVAHLNQVPIIPDELPEPLKKIIGTALQKLLPKRFQNAQAMRQALLQVSAQCHAGALTPGAIGGKVLPPIRSAPHLSRIAIPHDIEVMGLVGLPGQAMANEQDSPSPSQLLIASSQGYVWFYHWPNRGPITSPGPTQGFTLPAPVQQFVPTPQGGLLVTETSLHLLSMTHGLGRIAQRPIQYVQRFHPMANGLPPFNKLRPAPLSC
ncbi:MAG: serine/threonine protein kinase [Leptolyngbyaceae cyanobacterium SM2_5_2]|nr:serine/threonine protein kinase [Leptolyngbyaceae cyanobacterium SM2_5_2]